MPKPTYLARTTIVKMKVHMEKPQEKVAALQKRKDSCLHQEEVEQQLLLGPLLEGLWAYLGVQVQFNA
jgi:hypothetical protein